MAIPIINDWEKYFTDPHEGLGLHMSGWSLITC